MTRYGPQFGPDITFLGVRRCDLDEPDTYADADVVILGAPFDGGASYRAGTRFGPQAIRMTDYLPHDGSRPSLALRTDGLTELNVYDAGDVEMYSGDIEVALPALEAAVEKVALVGAIPVSLGGDHSIAYPDAKGCANVIGAGRVSMIHFDAHADTGDIEFGSLWGHGQPMRRLIESGALRGDRFLQIGLRGYWPPPETLDWMAAQNMRSYEMTEIVNRGLSSCLSEAFTIATDECEGVFLSVDIDVCDPGHAPGTGTPDFQRYSDVKLDPAAGSVWQAGRRLPLSRKQFRILEYLMRRRGEVVPHRLLRQRVRIAGDGARRVSLEMGRRHRAAAIAHPGHSAGARSGHRGGGRSRRGLWQS